MNLKQTLPLWGSIVNFLFKIMKYKWRTLKRKKKKKSWRTDREPQKKGRKLPNFLKVLLTAVRSYEMLLIKTSDTIKTSYWYKYLSFCIIFVFQAQLRRIDWSKMHGMCKRRESEKRKGQLTWKCPESEDWLIKLMLGLTGKREVILYGFFFVLWFWKKHQCLHFTATVDPTLIHKSRWIREPHHCPWMP